MAQLNSNVRRKGAQRSGVKELKQTGARSARARPKLILNLTYCPAGPAGSESCRTDRVLGGGERDQKGKLLFKKNFLWDFFLLYSAALLHLPPLRFHCADGC